MSNKKLPTTWATSKISDLCDLAKEKGKEGVVPYLEIGNVDIDQKTYNLTNKQSVKGCRTAMQNDVLVSRVRPTRGAIIRVLEKQIPVSSAFSILRDNGAFAEKYLWLFLAWNRDYLKYLGENCTGTMYPTTSDAVVGDFEIPVAPVNEQHRIVEKIEELLSEVEASIKELESAQKKLKLYRASVLNAACSGKLVPTEAELAKKEKRSYETGADLLARILNERGEMCRDHDEYKKSLEQDCPDLPPTPNGWIYCSAENVSDIVDPQPSHRTPKEVLGGVPYISIGDVKVDGTLDFQNSLKVSPVVLLEQQQRYKLFEGNFAIGKIGTVGKVIRLQLPFEYALSANVVLVQPNPQYIHPEYLQLLFSSPLMQGLISGGSRATSQSAFGIKKFRQLPVALPPLVEQERIVAEVERRISVIDETEGIISANLQRATRLRQSILEQAFSGKLVPQDPSDEPASMLLEKIKAEREKSTSAKKASPRAPRGRKRVKKA